MNPHKVANFLPVFLKVCLLLFMAKKMERKMKITNLYYNFVSKLQWPFTPNGSQFLFSKSGLSIFLLYVGDKLVQNVYNEYGALKIN